MKIYISLPITGYDLQERKRYADSVKKRLQQVYTDSEIITPFDVCTDPSLPYEELVGKDIAALLTCVWSMYAMEAITAKAAALNATLHSSTE